MSLIHNLKKLLSQKYISIFTEKLLFYVIFV